MEIICKHCQESCKKIGLVKCEKNNPKANRPKQLEINEAYKEGDYELAKRLTEELFRMNHG